MGFTAKGDAPVPSYAQGLSHCRARRNLALSKRMAYADTPKGADATEPEDGEPLRSWAGQHEAAVTASRNSHGSSAAFPYIVQSIKERN